MNKNDNPSLSIMDNESVSHEAIDSVIKNESSRDSWYRWHLIRDLIQNKTADFVAPDLHLRIAQAIAEEPTLMVPAARREVSNWRRKISQWGEQLTSYAIAASVTTFILYSVQQIQTPSLENSSAITTLELIEPTDYQIANQASPLQEQLLDYSRMSSIYGGQHMANYVQGVNYSVAIPLRPLAEKQVLKLSTPEESNDDKDKQQAPQQP